MNKNLRAGLIVVGVVAAVLVLAFVAQAAGLNPSRWADMPYGGQMGRQSVGGMGGTMSMMGSVGGAFQNGARGGHMMDVDQMPHLNQDGVNGQFENCLYWQSQNQ